MTKNTDSVHSKPREETGNIKLAINILNSVCWGDKVNHQLNAAISVLLQSHSELLDALRSALSEIDGREYVAACVDDGISPELRRLWQLRDKIKSAITKAQGEPGLQSTHNNPHGG